MNLLAIVLLAQLAGPARQTVPVLSFPEAGLDDSAAYLGYQTRLFRDAAGNTVQIYIDGRDGRVVHLWADAEDESIGFTARDAHGKPSSLRWGGAGATVSIAGGARTLEYRLVADASEIHIGWFLLGSMRVERDFQHAGRHRAPFGGAPFALPEMDGLFTALGTLPAPEQRRHLALLAAPDTATLRARLHPIITTRSTGASWVTRLVQSSFDGRDSLVLELRADPRRVDAKRIGDLINLHARTGDSVPFTVRITTSGKPLTPLTRREIFNPRFLQFLAAARAAGADTSARRARRMERQVRGMELLASREKLMAGLPTYATYFGRDMLMTALMMRPIWREEMSEFVIASVLRKLAPAGDVSHEEALGGQAVREAAVEYASLVTAHLRAARGGDRAAADTLLSRARAVVGDLRRVRENYHMIDDEFQLAVLAGRWLGDAAVSRERKRAFLLDEADSGEPRLNRLLRELALVVRLAAPYAADQVATNLVSFPPRDSTRWSSASWRDSNAGYAGGRFAMDINAIWVPHALESVGVALDVLRALGFSLDSLERIIPALRAGTPLGRYARDSLALRDALDAWRGAARHFVVQLGPSDVRAGITARLGALPPEERVYWSRRLAASKADSDSLSFLALSLDAAGRPIAVANSDPATRLFLGDDERRVRRSDAPAAEAVRRDVRLFTRDYPAGLFVDRVGPVVANDAYGAPDLWRAFERDHYHGPRVVWGREVNLFLLGVANRMADAGGSALAPHVPELRAALARVLGAVEASGFHSELWSYQFRDGRPVAVRYGTGSDVQLWSTTDLAVQFALWRLGR